MSWFGSPSPHFAGAGASVATSHRSDAAPGAVVPFRGARRLPRDTRVSRYALLGRARSSRWGELPEASPAVRHTSPRFATERSAARSTADTGQPGVVIIAAPSDLLAQLVATTLLYAHVPTCQLDPSELSSVELGWHGRSVTLNGQPIRGLLWRALRPGSGHLKPKTVASWLAVASWPTMRAINSYDSEAWCRGAGWSVWGDRLADGGVPVQPEPDPAAAPSRSLVVCGAVVSGPDTGPVKAAAATLQKSGVRLASVTSLPTGRVSNVDPQPEVSDSVDARRAAARIANYLAA
ncbi:MAG: hypothetical protein HKN74_02460 [Acidimicrobiia bacterium]|nr:hypothetical protein [Acidimicrobiia bacterium]NNF09125.1 hypothetical protein [Acidimicrobiia bacterium]NNL70472.1 hypothetical protein [Acidimicrobiia bacterium]